MREVQTTVGRVKPALSRADVLALRDSHWVSRCALALLVDRTRDTLHAHGEASGAAAGPNADDRAGQAHALPP